MSGRLVSLGVALALLVALAGAIVAACYDLPTPDCGFACGANGACPDGYACAGDQRCHRNGAPADLVCSSPDAGLPSGNASDGAPDARPDAARDAMPDTMVDTMVDAMPDAMPDTMVDAPVDPPIDAPVDVMDDAPDD